MGTVNDFTNGGLFNQSQREDCQIVCYEKIKNRMANNTKYNYFNPSIRDRVHHSGMLLYLHLKRF